MCLWHIRYVCEYLQRLYSIITSLSPFRILWYLSWEILWSQITSTENNWRLAGEDLCFSWHLFWILGSFREISLENSPQGRCCISAPRGNDSPICRVVFVNPHCNCGGATFCLFVCFQIHEIPSTTWSVFYFASLEETSHWAQSTEACSPLNVFTAPCTSSLPISNT